MAEVLSARVLDSAITVKSSLSADTEIETP